MRLPPTQEAPARARAWVRGALGDASDDRAEAVRLLVSELVTNSVRHADLGRHDRILVSVETADGRVKVEVTDPGAGFEPLRSPAPNHDSGYGLVLVDRVADRWGVRSEGVTTVWFELDVA